MTSALVAACASTRQPSAVAPAPLASSAKEILPQDLDAAIWLDVNRLRGLWSLQPNRQIAAILAEYGVFVTASDSEAAFWLNLLAQSDRWWIACRPTRDGCRDSVVFARGHFDRRDPSLGFPDVTSPMDLGAGWLRYDRRTKVGRQQAARLYASPPDRTLVVSPAEIDAVERTLERGKHDDPLVVEERGMVSIAFRSIALARILEKGAPSAARLLREARGVRLWLDVNAEHLELNATVSFPDPQRAERARLAYAVVAESLGGSKGRTGPEPHAVVIGNDFVLRLQFHSPSAAPQSTGDDSSAAEMPEPAAQ